MKIDLKTLPDDVNLLKKLIFQQASQIDNLLETIRLDKANRFAASSEKSPDQVELFDEAEAIDECIEPVVEDEIQGNEPTPSTPSKNNRGRKALPAHLPREERVIELPESERTCSCGCVKTEMGEESSERLEIIPAKLNVIRTIRKKYACRQCEGGVQVAPKPSELLPKSNASASALAYIITSKYQDGLPLHRLSTIFTRYDIDLPRQTLSNWVLNTANQLNPLVDVFQRHILQGNVIFIDETTVQVLNEKDKKAESKSYMWVQKGGPPDQPAVLFHYNPSRSSKVPLCLLEGFEGAIMSDGYPGYNAVARESGVTHLVCMAHLRRKFVEANKAVPARKKGQGVNRAQYMVNLLKKLYAIESKCQAMSIEERFEYRQAHAVPVIETIKAWLDKTSPNVTPKSKLGIALNYALTYWDRATRYVENGEWPIDNNAAENAIRPFVIGRKNWLFSHSVRGAESSALLYSLIETAKLNGHEPYEYLSWLFNEFPKGNKSPEELMPWLVNPEEIKHS